MPRVVELTFPPEQRPGADRDALLAACARRLRCDPPELAEVRPRKLSFDARRGRRHWRLAVDVWARGEDVPPAPTTSPPPLSPAADDAPHVVVVGSGPAGLFCALDLVRAGLRVTVIERGRDVQARRRDIARLHKGSPAAPDSNYCHGEGGAGTYSDGKLYTRSGRRRAVREVLETLVAHGAPSEILYDWRPHIGSNRLPEVVRSIRESLVAAGAPVLFERRVTALETHGSPPAVGAVTALTGEGENERIPCDAVVFATGHSALDSLRTAAAAGARLAPKGFALGVRIEHPQAWLDAHQYGGLREPCDLPAAFYELTTQVEERGVYSFCMCPGGFIVPASTAPDRVVVNGMSLSRRDSPFANSGLVVALEPEDWCAASDLAWGWSEFFARARARGVDAPNALPNTPEDDPLFGVRLQECLEQLAAVLGGGANRAPSQRADLVASGGGVGDALPTSYRPGVTPVDLGDLLPAGIHRRLRRGLAVFEERIPGFASASGQLIGVETRTSSPVRLERDPGSCEAVGLDRFYPCGEGAGFAGGIVSAALDGRRVARALADALA